MALSIKDPETDALVRELARVRGTSYTRAIRLAVENELAREPKPKRSFEEVWAEVKKIQEEAAALPLLDDRTPDEIIGYDENGVPS